MIGKFYTIKSKNRYNGKICMELGRDEDEVRVQVTGIAGMPVLIVPESNLEPVEPIERTKPANTIIEPLKMVFKFANCPFCGSRPHVRIFPCTASGKIEAEAMCTNCDMSMSQCESEGLVALEILKRRWNSRK